VYILIKRRRIEQMDVVVVVVVWSSEKSKTINDLKINKN
jgi:hypothetical protein